MSTVRTRGVCPSILAVLLESTISNGVGIEPVDHGGGHTLSEVMACLQLATAAIAIARLWEWMGIWRS